MVFIVYTLLAGLLSGCVSLYFRQREIKEEVILIPGHIASQIVFFIGILLIFGEYFSDIFIDLGFVKLSWIIIYIIFSSLSYYALQVFYEFFSGNTLFASEAEMKRFIEKLERDKHSDR